MFQNEKIVETKHCKHCSSSFEITDKDLEFYEKVSPVFSCRDTICRDTINRVSTKKYLIPPPTLCPDCRQQRRLSFRNERKLYKRKCDGTGKDIISIYSPDKPYKIYEQNYWWSDNWDALDYGRDFDFNRSFFEQFGELMREVPMCSLTTEYTKQENCGYTNCAGPGKNCYMSFEWAFCENMFFSKSIYGSTNIYDCLYCNDCENCYECIDSDKCFNSKYLNQCENCSNSRYLYNCKNCEFCFNCFGLDGKKYHINNKDYFNVENYKKAFNTIKKEELNIQYLENGKNYGNENVNKVYNVKNSKDCYDIKNSWNLESCKFCSDISNSKNCYDFFSWGENTDLCYELQETGRNIFGSAFLWLCWGEIKNSFYSFYCVNGCSNLFGCIGLKNKSYCIFNKQYTKEEYEKLVPKIIEHMISTGEWGEFFPSSISPFGYNETVAQEYYPLDRKDTINRVSTDGKQIFNWSTYEAPFPKVDKIIPAKLLPENIADIPDDILNRAIMPDDECDENDVGTGFKPVPTEKQIKKPFRIIPQELEFYRKHNIPIPHKHPDVRHEERMALRNPRKLFDKKCDKCGKDMKTTYSPDRKEIVYCEGCYNREVY